jgi:hypothetical protein
MTGWSQKPRAGLVPWWTQEGEDGERSLGPGLWVHPNDMLVQIYTFVISLSQDHASARDNQQKPQCTHHHW